jgi:hypothetical protein
VGHAGAVELLDPVDRHDDAQSFLDLGPLDRWERRRPQVTVDPDPRGRFTLDMEVRAAHFDDMREDGL